MLVVSGSVGRAADNPTADSPSLLVIDWKLLKDQGSLKAGEIGSDEGPQKSPLRIVSHGGGLNGKANIITIAEIDSPPIEKQVYCLSGWVRYRDVEGKGFAEMVSDSPDGSQYTSRTLGTAGGAMSPFTGTSEWRPIELAFQRASKTQSPPPNRLRVNIVFPGSGTVWLSNLKLTDTDTLLIPLSEPTPWTSLAGGIVSGFALSFLLIGGAMLGALVYRGIGREFVLVGAGVGIASGGVLLAIGMIAAITKQPVAAFFPALGLGAICATAWTVALVAFRHRYVRLQLRRITAMEGDH